MKRRLRIRLHLQGLGMNFSRSVYDSLDRMNRFTFSLFDILSDSLLRTVSSAGGLLGCFYTRVLSGDYGSGISNTLVLFTPILSLGILFNVWRMSSRQRKTRRTPLLSTDSPDALSEQNTNQLSGQAALQSPAGSCYANH